MKSMKKASFITYILAAAILLSSCTPSSQEYEELIEPVSEVTTFRSVQRRDIGKEVTNFAVVKGTDYCHFFEKSVKIKSINASIGQFVNEGDVLCEADIDSVKSELEGLKSELALLEEEHKLDQKDLEVRKKILELNEEYSRYDKNFGSGSQSDVEEAGNDLLIYEEDKEYANLLYEFKKEKINESMTSLNKIVKEGVIKARKSGYVTYVKDLTYSVEANPNENIVIVTDYDDLYLESQISTQNYQYKSYEVKYALIDGEKKEIEEYDYTDAEAAYYRVQGMYPAQRFKTVSDCELKIGDTVIICFIQKDRRDCICVGNDSLRVDEDGRFVYVKKDGNEVEKRYIEVGERDNHYTEVISGLEEGEEVLYIQEETVPIVSKEAVITLDDYVLIDSVRFMEMAPEASYSYANRQKGEMYEIYVKDNDEVKKGDALFKVKIDSKKSGIVELENMITAEDRSHENLVTGFNEKYEDFNKAKNDNKTDSQNNEKRLTEVKNSLKAGNLTPEETSSLNEEKSLLEDTINRNNYAVKFNELYLEQLQIERTREQKEHEASIASYKRQLSELKKIDDGSGYETVYAVADGTIKIHSSYKEGDVLEANTRVMSSSLYSKDKVKITASMPAETGYVFNIVSDDVNYEATSLSGSFKGKTYFFTIDQKVYGTTCTNNSDGVIAKVSDESFFDKDLKGRITQIEAMRINNVVMVPREFVFTEVNEENSKSKYVWVLKNNIPNKEYISCADNSGLGDYIVLAGVNVGDTVVK
ncbi:MAG: efflux RND transporter periplasmic adaptor subunit [Lachnospiraceae bacterium]|nr:efflux RND transporter periplasmic adaptor subunit [Lachnospiraceae bacterium]